MNFSKYEANSSCIDFLNREVCIFINMCENYKARVRVLSSTVKMEQFKKVSSLRSTVKSMAVNTTSCQALYTLIYVGLNIMQEHAVQLASQEIANLSLCIVLLLF